jgi:hypothetical protein
LFIIKADVKPNQKGKARKKIARLKISKCILKVAFRERDGSGLSFSPCNARSAI